MQMTKEQQQAVSDLIKMCERLAKKYPLRRWKWIKGEGLVMLEARNGEQ